MSEIVGPGVNFSSALAEEAKRDAAAMLAISTRNAKRGVLAPMMLKMTAAEAKKQAVLELLAQAEQEAVEDTRKLESSAAFLSLDDVDQEKREVSV